MPVKEPLFFATELRNAKWRAGGSPTATLEDYLSLFDAAVPGQRVGEASPVYLWSRSAASRIAVAQPAARIVAILREPSSFLRSLHLQFRKNHIETEKELRAALHLEDARREGKYVPRSSPVWRQLLLYADYVRYTEQLRRYHAVFPSEQILALIYDDFRHDNEAIVRRVLRFLDVGDTCPIQTRDANPTVSTRFQRLDDLVQEVVVGRGPITRIVNAGVKGLTPRGLRRYVLDVARPRIVHAKPPPADGSLMLELRRRFKPEVVALSEYLGRDLVSQWGYDD